MKKEIRAENAKLRRKYQQYLAEAIGNSEKTVTQKCSHIYAYEQYFNRDLKKCGKKEFFIEYKTHLRDVEISLNTFGNICHAIGEFYTLLSYDLRKVTSPFDLAFLRIKLKERNAMKSSNILKKIPKIEDFRAFVDSIDIDTEVDMRNKCLPVFQLFSPSRVDATIQLKLKHFNRDELKVVMDPMREVDTKNSLGYWGKLLVFEPNYLKYITDYVDFLIDEKNFTGEDPLFPATLSEVKDSDSYFTADRLSKKPWRSTISVRRVLKNLSEKAELEYFSPHRYRDLHYYLARKCCINEEQRNAVEMNLGHRGRSTAEMYYGNIEKDERFDILRKIDFSKHDQGEQPTNEDLYKMMKDLQKEIKKRNKK